MQERIAKPLVVLSVMYLRHNYHLVSSREPVEKSTSNSEDDT
jgi:hypothetical protein